MYNADIQAGHLRAKYDVIVFPDSSSRSILEGHRPGTIPERYAGGIGQAGVDELRDFVNDGGTLVMFNNASLFAIEQFNLPVMNALAGLTPNQFFCSGCLLKVHLEDAKNPLTAGLSSDPIVMFERGPAFEHEARFQGRGTGAVCEGAVAARERLSDGAGAAAREGRGAGCQLRQGAHHPAGIPAAVARAIARGVQVFVQCAVLAGNNGYWHLGLRRVTRLS